MREPFGVAAPVFIAVCLVKSDFLDWSTRKVSTYLPSVQVNCQDPRGEKSALTVPALQDGSLCIVPDPHALRTCTFSQQRISAAVPFVSLNRRIETELERFAHSARCL